jgi:dienelactone hydrolase
MKAGAALGALVALLGCSVSAAAEPAVDTARGDKMIAAYFLDQTTQLQNACLADVRSLADWNARRAEYRRQLLEMLGLDPLPEKTPLDAVISGKTEHDEFVVEKLHFQSRPELYVTGNLYLPRNRRERAPTILYVCGHGAVKQDGISYGNKVHYHHHGSWFARNGYVCLTIDTLQLGEIEGIHHGTYREKMWWWLNRGYTPAGVEAWNCVRALDYLETRPEVDAARIGVTGRSGGGAYSWWIAAIDQRVKVAVPVAGITDLANHVVDGCVEGHCDCMYMVNTYRWDYPLVAALMAPRPLLISNTDSDDIFPLDGVVRTFESVRRIYDLHDAGPMVALNITAGPHMDTQELRIHAFRWFNKHLKNEEQLVDKTASKFFEPQQLRVFATLPEGEINTEIHETFVAPAEAPEIPVDDSRWQQLRSNWHSVLAEKSFAAWPAKKAPLDMTEVFSSERAGVRLQAYDFTSQSGIGLRLYLARRAGLERPDLTVLNVLDQPAWNDFLATLRPAFEKDLAGESLPDADRQSFIELQQMFKSFKWAMAYVAPRGVGPTVWDQSEKKQTQHRRRFYLLGQSLDGMRVFDVRRAIQAVRSLDGQSDVPLWLQSHRGMAGVTLYASLFEPEITRLDLYELPETHRKGPFFLNVRRYLDMPQAVAMAAERSQVVIYDRHPARWQYPASVARQLGWDDKKLQIREPLEEPR